MRTHRHLSISTGLALATAAGLTVLTSAQTPQKAAPIFADGQAQIVPAFEDASQWIRQVLGVRCSSRLSLSDSIRVHG